MLWLLLLLQVWASCLWLGHSEVGTSFDSCLEFFYQNTPPNSALKPEDPAWICQVYDNQYCFATLYDKSRRIPMYSAYKYEPGESPKPQIWMVEPQLMGSTYPKEMNTESTLIDEYHVNIEEIKRSQAVLEDYQGLKGLTRGHLNPVGHHPTYKKKLPTNTLTNIVPQDEKLNNGAWTKYEQGTMIKKTKGCNSTYVIVGAVPGNSKIPSGRVNIPSHIWSSACCETGTGMRAWAVIAENNKNKVDLLTLGELEAKLASLYGLKEVSLFHSDCPRK
ncbi:endonuclease domain-containing 1 protein-like [Pithys albifrons albifrons]|uniref:endonuclease domain-containing 1 protein-like n=1 Tax=Pithys albifrons albifrons TaxID=3385563 RepID=UPI003A5D1CC4